MKRLLAVALAAGIAVSGCSSKPAETPAPTATQATSAPQTATFPATVKSCDKEITLAKAPENVVMLGDTGASIMLKLNVLDKVKHRAGTLVPDAWSKEDFAKIEAIPALKAEVQDTGGAKVATEVLLEARPDLVIGYETGLDKEALAKAGIPFYSPDAMCANNPIKQADWTAVTNEIEKYGKMFGVPDLAAAAVKDVNDQIVAMTPKGETRTVAPLYITPGSKEFYAYGAPSMVNPVMAANGMKNVYGDQEKRVFDASVEDLLAKNPDVIVLLWMEGKKDEVKSTFLGFPGVDKMKAVKDGKVYILPFALTDPPSLNSLKGATVLQETMK